MGVVVGIYVDILLLVLEGQEAADPRKAAIRAARGERGKYHQHGRPQLGPRIYLMVKGIFLSDIV